MQGDPAQARQCFERCAAATLPARDLDAGAGKQRILLPPLSASEMYAGALAGSAQAALSTGDQSTAEDLLGQARAWHCCSQLWPMQPCLQPAP